MYYSEFHNHKWAKNLSFARKLWEQGRFEDLYRGTQMPDGDTFGGLRVITAYWVSVEHEMPLRLATLLRGSHHEDWLQDPEIAAQGREFFERYLADMRELIEREKICPLDQFNALTAAGVDRPDDWAVKMRTWQADTEKLIAAGQFPEEVFNTWINSCMRSVADYNRYLILGGVCAAALVRREGNAALKAAVDRTAEEFMWEVSKAFYVTALPSAGFEDLGDLMELGLKGMFADQYFHSEPEQQDGERTIRHSILDNCELAGIYHAVAEWNGLPKLALGYGICRFCEVHGQATMMVALPPMVAPSYRLIESLGLHDRPCDYELVTVPAEDMPRMLLVQEKVFGAVE